MIWLSPRDLHAYVQDVYAKPFEIRYSSWRSLWIASIPNCVRHHGDNHLIWSRNAKEEA